MVGNYFKTGKTIVIDDQLEEAKPLLNSLYKHQIPHYYSDGRPSSDFPLPSKPTQFRLVFLDLNLQLQSSMGSSDSDAYKNFKAQHSNIFESILGNDNHSYILVIWSQEEEEYGEHFEKIFDTSEKYHTLKKPYRSISLKKADFFNNKEWIPGQEDELYRRINEALSSLDTYKLFCEWERIVNESAAETFDAIFQLVNSYDANGKEEYLKKLITLLSIAYAGDEGYLNLDNDQMRTDSVLLALNQILDDDIDRLILDKRQEEYKNWVQVSNSKEISSLRKEINRGLVNTKLFTFSPNKPELTGSLYAIYKRNFNRKIFDDSIHNQIGAIKSHVSKEYKRDNDNQGPTDVQKEQLVANFVEELYKKIIPVELNMTPLCDVSQGNDMMHRILPGFIVPAEHQNMNLFQKKTINRGLGYALSTDIFDVSGLHKYIKLTGNAFIYFDMRFFTSISKNQIKKRTKESRTLPRYLFTLRNNLINEFQVGLSNHISRLGVLYLQE
ncbi:MAG: hypothetical protein AAF849_10445 [Bacteroidota bacterium]